MSARRTTAAAQYLADLDARVQVGGRTRETSSAPVFDAGRAGLDFFRAFGPVHARYRDERFDYAHDIAEKYDGQREIGFARLHADADRLRELHATMAETTVDFRNAASPLFGAWRGKAAEEAHDRLHELVSTAGGTWSGIVALADTIDLATTAAERIVVAKARFVRDLAADDVGGLSATEVDLVVSVAGERGKPTDQSLTALANLCGIRANPKVCRTNADLLRMIAHDVRGWLDHVFVPFYEARRDAFDAACSHASADLAAAWELLREALTRTASEHGSPTVALTGSMATAVKSPPTAAPAEPSRTATDAASAAANVQPSAGPHDKTPDDSDQLEPGVVTGSDETEMMGMVGPTGPASAVPGPAPPSAAQVQTGYGGYYPLTGFPPDGGDRERRRSLPLTGGSLFGDGDAGADGSLVIGSGDDETLYNEDDVAALVERERPEPGTEDDLDEEDLW